MRSLGKLEGKMFLEIMSDNKLPQYTSTVVECVCFVVVFVKQRSRQTTHIKSNCTPVILTSITPLEDSRQYHGRKYGLSLYDYMLRECCKYEKMTK